MTIWATDEHRLGLKPVLRRVWARRGGRPRATVHHRYQWLWLVAFAQPATGESHWYLLPRIRADTFGLALAEFAAAVGAGPAHRVVLVLDQAGWHVSGELVVPEGLHFVFLPPYSPEVQPIERLWPLSDEPVVNRALADLDELEEIMAARCVALMADRPTVRRHTHFHWWPASRYEQEAITAI